MKCCGGSCWVGWIATPAPAGWVPERFAVDAFMDRKPHQRGMNVHGYFMRNLTDQDKPPEAWIGA